MNRQYFLRASFGHCFRLPGMAALLASCSIMFFALVVLILNLRRLSQLSPISVMLVASIPLYVMIGCILRVGILCRRLPDPFNVWAFTAVASFLFVFHTSGLVFFALAPEGMTDWPPALVGIATLVSTVIGALVGLNRRRKAMPQLIQALDNEDAVVRWVAISALWGIGQSAYEAVPKLLILLNDEDVSVRCSAYLAVLRIDPVTLKSKNIVSPP